MIQSQNVHSLTEFVRNSKSFVRKLDEDREPLGLTVNGKVKLVVLDAETFEELWEAQEKEQFLEAIREGMRDVREGRHRPAADVLREIRAKYEL